MRVHSGSSVPKNRLGHKRGGFPIGKRDIFDNVFISHHSISHLYQWSKLKVDLRLPSRGDFMVLAFDF